MAILGFDLAAIFLPVADLRVSDVLSQAITVLDRWTQLEPDPLFFRFFIFQTVNLIPVELCAGLSCGFVPSTG